MSPRKLRYRGRTRLSAHENVETEEGSWAVSYGDMVTLLLTFFIVFFTADKFQMQKNLKLDLVAKHTQMGRDIASELKAGIYPSLEVQEAVRGKVYQIGQKVIIEFSGVSFFRSGEVELTASAQKSLTQFYRYYSPYMGQFNLSVRAFTDTKKVRQDLNHRFRDNLELSALRSISVMRHLQKTGVPLQNMKLSGYGEMKISPEELNSVPEEKRKPTSNLDFARTAVLVIEPKEDL